MGFFKLHARRRLQRHAGSRIERSKREDCSRYAASFFGEEVECRASVSLSRNVLFVREQKFPQVMSGPTESIVSSWMPSELR